MGLVTSLVVAGVSLAATVGSAYAKKAAADKAAKAQEAALTQQQKILNDELSYSKVNKASVDASRNQAKARIALQEEIDPELAQVRQLGKQKLLEEAQKPTASAQSQQVARQIFQENITPDANMEALKTSIIQKAQQDIAAGATLPPEFQAELVRAGVSTGAQAGLRPTQSTIGGRTAQVLGGAGIQLGQQRVQEATNLANTAMNLTDSRARLLSSIFPSVATAENTARQVAVGTFAIGDQTLPQAGLSGAEAANLQINRGNTMLGLAGKKGQVDAQRQIASGDATASYIGAVGKAAGTAAGLAGNYYGGGSSVSPGLAGRIAAA